MLENFSVHQIISKIKKREIKIVEVLNFYLDRIKKFNPKLNAIISHIDETKNRSLAIYIYIDTLSVYMYRT